jgi:hypothetical protein
VVVIYGIEVDISYYWRVLRWPITVAARSKAWTVFARSNTGIVGSNPTRCLNICVRVFCICVLCIGSCLVTDWSPAQGVLPTVHRLRNWKKRPRSTSGPGHVGFVVGQSGAGVGFLRVLRVPLQSSFAPPITPQSPSCIIRGMYNRPMCGRSAGT